MTKTPLIVGRIPYLVGAPFYECLKKTGKYQFADGHPKELNKLLASGEIDLAPSSSILFGQNPLDYQLFSHICTAGEGTIGSVFLFSQINLEDLDGIVLYKTPASETSVTLLELILRVYLKKTVTYTKNINKAQAALLIGNEAMQHKERKSWPYVYDLAKIWFDWKGLPFVFGLWIVRKKAVLEKKELLNLFAQDLENAVNDFYGNLPLHTQNWERKFPSGIPLAESLLYFQSIQYKFAQKHREGLSSFYRECFQNHIIKNAVTLDFFSH